MHAFTSPPSGSATPVKKTVAISKTLQKTQGNPVKIAQVITQTNTDELTFNEDEQTWESAAVQQKIAQNMVQEENMNDEGMIQNLVEHANALDQAIVAEETLVSVQRNSARTTQHEVTLLTATVVVSNPMTRGKGRSFLAHVFFDNGSQKSFITEDLARKLGMESQGVETLSVFTFFTEKSQQIKSRSNEVIIHTNTVVPKPSHR